MKIEVEFTEGDIEELLISKVNSMGVMVNKCNIKASYGRLDKATVWYEEPVVPAPVQGPTLPDSDYAENPNGAA